VACTQCKLGHAAPSEVGVCEHCRRLNAIELREFFSAVTFIARLELQELGGRTVYPFRVPLSPIDAARLARAARALQEAARELELAELRRSKRKGPKRVDGSTQEKPWNDEQEGRAHATRRNPRGR